MTTPTDVLLKVERGDPAPEELAALTAVLLARVAARPAGKAVRRPAVTAGWHRQGRWPTFQAPHSWQDPAVPH